MSAKVEPCIPWVSVDSYPRTPWWWRPASGQRHWSVWDFATSLSSRSADAALDWTDMKTR